MISSKLSIGRLLAAAPFPPPLRLLSSPWLRYPSCFSISANVTASLRTTLS